MVFHSYKHKHIAYKYKANVKGHIVTSYIAYKSFVITPNNRRIITPSPFSIAALLLLPSIVLCTCVRTYQNKIYILT